MKSIVLCKSVTKLSIEETMKISPLRNMLNPIIHSSLVMSPSLLALKYLKILSMRMSSVMLKLEWRNCLNSFLSIFFSLLVFACCVCTALVVDPSFYIYKNVIMSWVSIRSFILTTVFLYKFNNLSISDDEKCVLFVRFSTIFFSCFFIAELALISDTTDMLIVLRIRRILNTSLCYIQIGELRGGRNFA